MAKTKKKSSYTENINEIKIAWCADIHAGKSGEALKYFQDIIDQSIENKCSHLFVGGDLYDDISTPRLRKDVKEIYIDAIERGLNIFTIRGNHDVPLDLYSLHNLKSEKAQSIITELPGLFEFDGFSVYAIPHFNTGRIKVFMPQFKDMTGQEIISWIIDDIERCIKESDKPVFVLGHGTIDGFQLDKNFIPKDNGIHVSLLDLQKLDAYVWFGHYHMKQILAKNVRSIDSQFPHTFAEGEEEKGFWIQSIIDNEAQEPEFISLNVPRIFNIKGSWKDKQWKGDVRKALERDPINFKGGKVKLSYTVRKEEIPSVPVSEIEKHFSQALVFEKNQITLYDRNVEIDISEVQTNDELLHIFYTEKKGLSKKEAERLINMKHEIIEKSVMETA